MFRKRTRPIIAKARELLFADGNYVALIFSVMIFALALVLPLVAYYLAYGYVEPTLLFVSLIVLELLVAMPLLFGMFRIAGLASDRVATGLFDLFYAFTSVGSYFKVLLLGFIQIFKHATPISVGYILARLVIYAFKLPIEEMSYLVILFVLASYFACLPLVCRLYAVNMLVMADGVGVIKAVKLSWKYTRANKSFLIVFSLKMLPLLMISIAAILVPLLIYTAPLLFCAYSVICRKLILSLKQNNMRPEESPLGLEEINE